MESYSICPCMSGLLFFKELPHCLPQWLDHFISPLGVDKGSQQQCTGAGRDSDLCKFLQYLPQS